MKGNFAVLQLIDEKEAVEEIDNLTLVEKAEIEDKLEDEAFSRLVESSQKQFLISV